MSESTLTGFSNTFAKEQLIIGLFCRKWRMKIRHPMTLYVIHMSESPLIGFSNTWESHVSMREASLKCQRGISPVNEVCHTHESGITHKLWDMSYIWVRNLSHENEVRLYGWGITHLRVRHFCGYIHEISTYIYTLYTWINVYMDKWIHDYMNQQMYTWLYGSNIYNNFCVRSNK